MTDITFCAQIHAELNFKRTDNKLIYIDKQKTEIKQTLIMLFFFIARQHALQGAIAIPLLTFCTMLGLYQSVCRNRKLFMDARSAMRPCYILPTFFVFFYGRLSWPNG